MIVEVNRPQRHFTKVTSKVFSHKYSVLLHLYSRCIAFTVDTPCRRVAIFRTSVPTQQRMNCANPINAARETKKFSLFFDSV